MIHLYTGIRAIYARVRLPKMQMCIIIRITVNGIENPKMIRVSRTARRRNDDPICSAVVRLYSYIIKRNRKRIRTRALETHQSPG